MFLSRKCVPPQGAVNPLYELQWGRDVSIPEMFRDRQSRARSHRLQWGRDVSIPEMWSPSPPRTGYPALQWGRDVSIPEIPWLLRPRPRYRRFNGAGMFLSRKSCRRPCPAWLPSRFNGAGMFLSRKCVLLTQHRRGQGGFNGAGMFLSRKCWRQEHGISLTGQLQWGRDVSIPEIGQKGLSTGLADLLQWGRDVSIPEIRSACLRRPRIRVLQWGRDVSIPEMTTLFSITCVAPGFNGAGMFLSRKSVRPGDPGSLHRL